MKKIALPVANGILCPHFGHSEQFHVFDVEGTKITNETILPPPPHEPGILPRWLSEKNVTDVIAGGMGQRAITLFNQQRINVYVGAPSKKPKELVEDFLNGTLETSINLCDH